jgi:hypothetical protein
MIESLRDTFLSNDRVIKSFTNILPAIYFAAKARYENTNTCSLNRYACVVKMWKITK